MKYLLFCLLILSFNAISGDEELEGYTFQKDYETKDSQRDVANKKRTAEETTNNEAAEVKRVKADYWEWTDKVE